MGGFVVVYLIIKKSFRIIQVDRKKKLNVSMEYDENQ